jgi:DNA polymerase-1
MEALGVFIDIKYLKTVEQQLSDKRECISQQVAKLLGEEVSASARLGARLNLASPEQVAELLYDRLKLPPPSSTVGGRHHSTSEDDLMKIRHLHPVIDLVFSYRACCKTLSTYIQGWSPFLCHYDTPAAKELHDRRINQLQDGDDSEASVYLIHARWNQTGVRTGRLSCSKPNLQNIPSMQSISGLEINMRMAVIARTGCDWPR